MDVIAGFTSEGFHRLDALNDKVAAAWRAAAHSETENWAEVLAKAAKGVTATLASCCWNWQQGTMKHRQPAWPPNAFCDRRWLAS